MYGAGGRRPLPTRTYETERGVIMENDTEALERAILDLADKVPGLTREGALEVLYAVWSLLERLDA